MITGFPLFRHILDRIFPTQLVEQVPQRVVLVLDLVFPGNVMRQNRAVPLAHQPLADLTAHVQMGRFALSTQREGDGSVERGRVLLDESRVLPDLSCHRCVSNNGRRGVRLSSHLIQAGLQPLLYSRWD